MIDDFHTPVLADAVLSFLQPTPDFVYVDATLGGGGHAESILRASSPSGRVIAFDADADGIQFAKVRLKEFSARIVYVHDNFVNIGKQIKQQYGGSVDGVLMDLGVSSHQLNDSSRGFSFQRPHRLDMRMDQRAAVDAQQVVNRYTAERLTEIFRSYGEERQSKRIARRIVDARSRAPIETTEQLSDIVQSVVGKQYLQKSLARVFQAIRIEVNSELDSLRTGLRQSMGVLKPGGRLVVISYHSLEDRIVKDFFREESRTSIPSGHKYLPDQAVRPQLQVLTKKPIGPDEIEIHRNPRSRSAKLRAYERVGT